MRPFLWLCSVLLFTVACGEDEESPRGNLDPEVAPIVDGTWYRPAVSATWQWQLLETVSTAYDVDVYDVDLFDTDAEMIDSLQTAGRRVLCYFCAGSSEDWRSDFGDFLDTDMGEPLDEWEGEQWLDIRSANVHKIVKNRLDMAVSKGCDGVEPDNVDGYANDTGFELKARDQLAFNRFFANEAHQRGLAVALKNDGGQAAELVDYFDLSLNEQCHEYDECDELATFTDNSKPIFNAEYKDTEAAASTWATTLCPQALSEDIRTLILPLDLDDNFRVSCD
jgi:hypothetical protein